MAEHPEPSCQNRFLKDYGFDEMPMMSDGILISSQEIQTNNEYLAKELDLPLSYIPHEKIKDETLQTAAEMFTFLNYCPDTFESLISHIIKTGTTKEIILALTSTIKSSRKVVKKSSIKIFQKLMENLNLRTYEKIQMITKEKCLINGIFDTCTKKMVYSNEELEFLGLPLGRVHLLTVQNFGIFRTFFFLKCSELH